MHHEILDTQQAGDLIREIIGDNRNYVWFLIDARRGRRAGPEPFCRDRRSRCLYLRQRIVEFAEGEKARRARPAAKKIILEGASLLEIMVKATKLK